MSQTLRSGGDDVLGYSKLLETSRGVPRGVKVICGGHLDLAIEISKSGFAKIFWIHPKPIFKGVSFVNGFEVVPENFGETRL